MTYITHEPHPTKRAPRAVEPKTSKLIEHGKQYQPRCRRMMSCEQIEHHAAEMRDRSYRGNGPGMASCSGIERREAALKGWETRCTQ